MAMLKTARARVVHPHIKPSQWNRVKTASKSTSKTASAVNADLTAKATELLGEAFDPDKYLLSHCTIVASVDTYTPEGTKTGTLVESGKKIYRKFSDFRITPETASFINHNFDSWSRDVILKSYKTFIGGQNYTEHVQLENLSKGRIIDAVVRDVGSSLYVDILVATNREHTELVKAIESGKMGTLSMGCSILGSSCTKCGNWAPDETEMCEHVKYEKGNTFFDSNGVQHVVAETCGHSSIEGGGVTFIEASWVETPAFTGAVLRNILEPTEQMAVQAQKILSTPPTQWAEDSQLKAASTKLAELAEDEWMGQEPDATEEAPIEEEAGPDTEEAPVEDTSLLQDVEDDAALIVKNRIRDKLKKELGFETPGHGVSELQNDNLNQVAALRVYNASLDTLTRTASSDAALINGIAHLNNSLGVNVPMALYRAALKIGDPADHGTVLKYKKACKQALLREPNNVEAKMLLHLAYILHQRGSLMDKPGSFAKKGDQP